MPSSTRSQEFIERGLDIAVSLLALIFLAPTMLAIAALVKFTSEGPIFSQAPRVGRGGRHFMLLKFRSTVYRAHASDPGGPPASPLQPG